MPNKSDERSVVSDGGQESQPALEPAALERGRALHRLLGRRHAAIAETQPRGGDAGRDRGAGFERLSRALEVSGPEMLVEPPRQRLEVAAPAPQVQPALRRQREAGHRQPAEEPENPTRTRGEQDLLDVFDGVHSSAQFGES